MFVLGAGVGMLMQNLVLVVQNSIEVKKLGVATSAVTFFRSLGGTVGVSVLGSVLGTSVATQIADGITKLSPADQATAAQALGSGTLPSISELSGAVRTLVESAYGAGVGHVFLYSVPLAIVTLIAVIFIPNARLGTENAQQLAKRNSDGSATDAAATGTPATGTPATPVTDAEDALIGSSAAAAALTPAGQTRPDGERSTDDSRADN
jgi:hypothetical protein